MSRWRGRTADVNGILGVRGTATLDHLSPAQKLPHTAPRGDPIAWGRFCDGEGLSDLDKELEGAVMDALQAHTAMSQQALGSKQLMSDLKSALLGAGKLWESLRAKAGQDLSA